MVTRPDERGLTLVELIVTCFILSILATAAVPAPAVRTAAKAAARTMRVLRIRIASSLAMGRPSKAAGDESQPRSLPLAADVA